MPAAAWAQLAQETGGMLFDSTNNLRQGFERIEDDLQNYYLVGYTPSNDTYDGRFRKIDVKVKRPGDHRGRAEGLFRLRDPGTARSTRGRRRRWAQLEQNPLPNAFPVRAGALLFPERDRPGLVPVVVEFRTAGDHLPAGQPTARPTPRTSRCIVRFLDRDNQVARKVSQHYEVNGPIGEPRAAKQGT